MICPVCGGRGEMKKRFLWFKWRGVCSRCRGAGWLEEDGSATFRVRRRESFREWADDDSSRWPAGDSATERDERFEVGDGGRSGGGGGGASWGDESAASDSAKAGDRDHPLIVDPFAAESAAAAESATVEASSADSSEPDGGTSSDESSSSEGTAY